MDKKKILNIVKIVFVAVLILVAALNYKTLKNIDIRELVSSASSIYVAAGIVLGIYFVKALLFVLPASVIYISVGLVFDWKIAVLVNMLGIVIEVITTYFFGKFLGKDAVEKRLSTTKGGEKLLAMKGRNKNTATFIIRFLPVFPIDFSSLFMGAFDFNFLMYLIFSVAGLAPRVIGFTILGDGIYKYLSLKNILIIAAVAVPIAAIILAVKLIRAKKKSAQTSK